MSCFASIGFYVGLEKEDECFASGGKKKRLG